MQEIFLLNIVKYYVEIFDLLSIWYIMSCVGVKVEVTEKFVHQFVWGIF